VRLSSITGKISLGRLWILRFVSEQDLWRLVVNRLGATGDGRADARTIAVNAELVPARALDPETRLDRDNTKIRNVWNWLQGRTTPNSGSLLSLLDHAGLLTPEASAALRGETIPMERDAARAEAATVRGRKAATEETTRATERERRHNGRRRRQEEAQG